MAGSSVFFFFSVFIRQLSQPNQCEPTCSPPPRHFGVGPRRHGQESTPLARTGPLSGVLGRGMPQPRLPAPARRRLLWRELAWNNFLSCLARVPAGLLGPSWGKRTGRVNGDYAPGSGHTGSAYIRVSCRTGVDPFFPFRNGDYTVKMKDDI